MEGRVHSERLEAMLAAAAGGCQAMFAALDRIVRARTERLLAARGT
jgi:hypothetical protein